MYIMCVCVYIHTHTHTHINIIPCSTLVRMFIIWFSHQICIHICTNLVNFHTYTHCIHVHIHAYVSHTWNTFNMGQPASDHCPGQGFLLFITTVIIIIKNREVIGQYSVQGGMWHVSSFNHLCARIRWAFFASWALVKMHEPAFCPDDA